MAIIRFLSGKLVSLPEKITDGQVYFAISDEDSNTGSILFDKDGERYTMAQAQNTSGYAVCNSFSNTSRKRVELTKSSYNWVPKEGSILYVKFSATNTGSFPSFDIYRTNMDNEPIISQARIYYEAQELPKEALAMAGEENHILAYVFDGENFHYIAGRKDESKGEYQNTTQKDYCVGDNDITQYSLVGLSVSGKMVPADSASFLIGGPLYITIADHNAEDMGTDSSFFERGSNLPLYCRANELDGIPYAPLYLKGTINGIEFIPDTNFPFVYSLPTVRTDASEGYIYIGEIENEYSDTEHFTYVNLSFNHPIYTLNANGKAGLYGSSLAHSLTIGSHVFDGSENVEVAIYNGDITIIKTT